MSQKAKLKSLEYGICFLFVAAFAGIYLWNLDAEGATRLDWYRYLCDAFTVPGLLLIFAGLITWVANEGGVDGILYILKHLAAFFIPGGRLNKEERYADFVAARREKKKGGFGFLLISGGITMAVSLVFLVLFSMESA